MVVDLQVILDQTVRVQFQGLKDILVVLDLMENQVRLQYSSLINFTHKS